MVTIHVWLPSFQQPRKSIPISSGSIAEKALGPIENVGHSALLLDGGDYLSWWPSEPVDRSFRSSTFRVHSLVDDIAAEGGAAAVTAEISGLDENAIASWWERIEERGFAIPYSVENNPKDTHFD